jgi:hypothetical protein
LIGYLREAWILSLHSLPTQPEVLYLMGLYMWRLDNISMKTIISNSDQLDMQTRIHNLGTDCVTTRIFPFISQASEKIVLLGYLVYELLRTVLGIRKPDDPLDVGNVTVSSLGASLTQKSISIKHSFLYNLVNKVSAFTHDLMFISLQSLFDASEVTSHYGNLNLIKITRGKTRKYGKGQEKTTGMVQYMSQVHTIGHRVMDNRKINKHAPAAQYVKQRNPHPSFMKVFCVYSTHPTLNLAVEITTWR